MHPMEVSDVELPSFSCTKCYLHVRIPPGTSIGHHADHWNVTQPDFTCSLKSVTKGDMYIIRLYDLESSELFAESFWHPDKPMASVIEAVVDSSRYFVLRIEQPGTNKHVFLGVGFHDRDEAGQFKTALHEHARYLRRMQTAAQEDSASAQAGQPAAPPADLSLKEPVTISVPDKLKREGGFLQRQTATSAVAVPVLRAASAMQRRLSSDGPPHLSPTKDGVKAVFGDDDFGDFVG